MPLNWGGIVVGTITGLGAGVLLAIPLLAIGVGDTSTFGGQAVLIFVGLIAQFLAGYVAGRFAGRDQAVHGGFAALLLFLSISIISIAAGSEPAVATLAIGGITALVMGSAGGVLASAHFVDQSD